MEILNKKWKYFLSIFTVLFIQKYFLPSQFEYYLKRDLISFSFVETLIIVGIIFLISLVIFYMYFLKERDVLIRLAKTFSYAVLFAFIYLIFIQNIIISVGLLVNRRVSRSEKIEVFEIVDISNNGDVEIKCLKSEFIEHTNKKFSNYELKNLRVGDTINTVFNIGLFGKKYLDSKLIKLIR